MIHPVADIIGQALHLKTGHIYLLHGGVINATNEQSGQEMALYSRDGQYYVREVSEFETKFDMGD